MIRSRVVKPSDIADRAQGRLRIEVDVDGSVSSLLVGPGGVGLPAQSLGTPHVVEVLAALAEHARYLPGRWVEHREADSGTLGIRTWVDVDGLDVAVTVALDAGNLTARALVRVRLTETDGPVVESCDLEASPTVFADVMEAVERHVRYASGGWVEHHREGVDDPDPPLSEEGILGLAPPSFGEVAEAGRTYERDDGLRIDVDSVRGSLVWGGCYMLEPGGRKMTARQPGVSSSEPASRWREVDPCA